MSCVLAPVGADAQEAGLYLRGDLGIAVSPDTEFTDKDPASPDALLGTIKTEGDFGNSVLLGIGLGYRVNDLFRIEATLGYLPGLSFSGRDDIDPDNVTTADATSLVAMVAGYVNLGRFVAADRINPYVGAGIGVARNELDDVQTTLWSGSRWSVPSGTSTGLAWMLAAGVSIEATPSVTVDLGYRYLDLGQAETDAGIVQTSGGARFQATGMEADLSAHVFNVGLRYTY